MSNSEVGRCRENPRELGFGIWVCLGFGAAGIRGVAAATWDPELGARDSGFGITESQFAPSPESQIPTGLLLDHLQRVGGDDHLAVFLRHVARNLDGMADVRDDLCVAVRRKTAAELVELPVLGEDGHRGALLRAHRGTVGLVAMVLGRVSLVLHVTGLVDDLALHRHFLGEGGRTQRYDERRRCQCCRELTHAGGLLKENRKKRSRLYPFRASDVNQSGSTRAGPARIQYI